MPAIWPWERALSPPSGADLQRWVAAGILADAADMAATVAAGDSLPRSGRLLVGAVASAGAVLGLLALAGMRQAASRA